MTIRKDLGGMAAVLTSALEYALGHRFGWKVLAAQVQDLDEIHVMAWDPDHPATAILQTRLSARCVRDGATACFNAAMAAADQAYSKTFNEVIAG